jgi:hypothetical protein
VGEENMMQVMSLYRSEWFGVVSPPKPSDVGTYMSFEAGKAQTPHSSENLPFLQTGEKINNKAIGSDLYQDYSPGNTRRTQ